MGEGQQWKREERSNTCCRCCCKVHTPRTPTKNWLLPKERRFFDSGDHAMCAQNPTKAAEMGLAPTEESTEVMHDRSEMKKTTSGSSKLHDEATVGTDVNESPKKE